MGKVCWSSSIKIQYNFKVSMIHKSDVYLWWLYVCSVLLYRQAQVSVYQLRYWHWQLFLVLVHYIDGFQKPCLTSATCCKISDAILNYLTGIGTTHKMGIFLIFSLLHDFFLHFHSQKQLMWNLCSCSTFSHVTL